MADFLAKTQLTRIAANLLKNLTDMDVITWECVDANCYLTEIGNQTFGFCQWHEGLEVNFDGQNFRGYDFGLSELRDAVYKQKERL